MPHGLNIATCLHCGRQWVVGDCIPSTCPECEAKGHRGLPLLNCPACERERAERREAAEATRLELLRREDSGFRVLFDSTRPRHVAGR